MIDKINNHNYSITRKDQFHDDGKGSKKRPYQEDKKKESKSTVLKNSSFQPEEALTLDDLKMMVEKLNTMDFYQQRSLKFKLIEDGDHSYVHLLAWNNNLVQELYPWQIKNIFSEIDETNKSPSKGRLLDIAC